MTFTYCESTYHHGNVIDCETVYVVKCLCKFCRAQLTLRFRIRTEQALFCIVIHSESWFFHQYCTFFCHFQVKHMLEFHISKKYKRFIYLRNINIWICLWKFHQKCGGPLIPGKNCFGRKQLILWKQYFQHHITIMFRPRSFVMLYIEFSYTHIQLQKS